MTFHKPAALALFIVGVMAHQPAFARASFIDHQAWADYHVRGLPQEIRASVLKLEPSCGDRIAATHSFAVTTNSGQFVSLHYERMWCPNRLVVCKGDDCLHQVFVRTNGRYRVVFSTYAYDTNLTHDENAVHLEILHAGTGSGSLLRWNGARFILIPMNGNAGHRQLR